MALVFYRRLAMPLAALGLSAVVLTASPAAMRVLIWALGITVVAVVIRPVVRWSSHTSCSILDVFPARSATESRAALAIAPTCGEATGEPNANRADDALALIRMTDDGGPLPQGV